MIKVAIIHDWLVVPGGAERIVNLMLDIFPDADVYTTVYDSHSMEGSIRTKKIYASFIQKLPFGRTKYQTYLPLMPIAVEQFDLTGYDLVISSSSSVAKGVVTDAKTLHICYCHTPMRYAWDLYHEYVGYEKPGLIKRSAIALLMNYIRMWDRLSADRVDYFIANSNYVARRIEKHYRRDSVTIYPPVNTEFYVPNNKTKEYFLVVSRLVPYKRVDLVVETFNKLGLPLVIVGHGSEYKKLVSIAKPNIQFKGRLSDEEVKEYYASCKALIFPGEEDFGITPLEAMASGRPVIAFRGGGAMETVVDGKTGIFFTEQSVAAITDAVERFLSAEKGFDPTIIREHAVKFNEAEFKEALFSFIWAKYESFKKGGN